MNEKQRRFGHEYILDSNSTKAAIRAGYSNKTAYSMGQRLLKKVEIQNLIAELRNDIEKTTNITVQKTLIELARIAFSDISDYLDINNGQVILKDLKELTKNQTAAIESIQQTKDGIKFKLYNKPQALELIGKHLGMFTETPKEENEFDLPPDIDKLNDADVERYYDSLRQKAN